MVPKPNYKFERLERQRAKAAKKATRLEAKKEKAEKRKVDDIDLESTDLESTGAGFGESPGEPPSPPQEDDGPDR